MTITYTKLTWQTYPASGKKMEIFEANIAISFTFGIRNLLLEQTKFPVFSLCFGKISKFPVFSLTRIFFCHFPFSLCRGYPDIWADCVHESVIYTQGNSCYVLSRKVRVRLINRVFNNSIRFGRCITIFKICPIHVFQVRYI